VNSFNHNSEANEEGELSVQDFVKKSKTPKETVIGLKNLDHKINQIEVKFESVASHQTEFNERPAFTSADQEM
jgi:hypothetical protein